MLKGFLNDNVNLFNLPALSIRFIVIKMQIGIKTMAGRTIMIEIEGD